MVDGRDQRGGQRLVTGRGEGRWGGGGERKLTKQRLVLKCARIMFTFFNIFFFGWCHLREKRGKGELM